MVRKWQSPPADTATETWLPIADVPASVKTNGTVIRVAVQISGTWIQGIAKWVDLGGGLTGWAAHSFLGMAMDRRLLAPSHWQMLSPPPGAP